MRGTDGPPSLVERAAERIVQLTDCDRGTFEHDYLYPRKPLCIREPNGHLDLTRWHPRHLAETVGHREVTLSDDSMAIDFADYYTEPAAN